MTRKEEAIIKLKQYDQNHIIEVLNKLDDEKQEKLIDQILKMNFDQIMSLYKSTKKNKPKILGKIEPINFIDKSKIDEEEKEKLLKIGEKVISQGNYAVVTMAGGQGTRLGFNGPKGTFKLDIGKNGKYIFEILVDTLKRASRQYNFESYWYIMTSKENNADTVKFFEENNYFGYNKEKVKFFWQGTLPLLSKDGKLLIGEDFKIREASDGNGGVYRALKDTGMLEDMQEKNIKWVHICGVDNIMVNMVDPIFLGMVIDKKVPIASKSIPKLCPEEKVGVFCKRDGKPSIIEYIELSEEMIRSKNNNGELLYGDANIVSHLLNIESIKKIAEQKLEYHLAIKKNTYLDENLEKIIPEEPNSYKFEAFIFDGFEYLEDMAVLRVKREEEFSPIKNAKGNDSPETAKKIYCKYWNL